MASPEDGGFLDIPYTIQMGDQLAKYGQANVHEIRIVCLPVMASFRKRPDQAILPTHITFQRLKTAPMRQLFQAASFQLFQVASLAAVLVGLK